MTVEATIPMTDGWSRPRLDATSGDGVAITVHLGRQPGPLVVRASLALELDCHPAAPAAVRDTTYTLERPDGTAAAFGHGAHLEAMLAGSAAEDLFGLALGLGSRSAPGWRVRARVVPADGYRTTWSTRACVQVDLHHLASVLAELTAHAELIDLPDLRRALPALLRAGAVSAVPALGDPGDLAEAVVALAAPVLSHEGRRLRLAEPAPWMRQCVERQVEVQTGETVELTTSLDELLTPVLTVARGRVVRLVGPFDRTGGTEDHRVPRGGIR